MNLRQAAEALLNHWEAGEYKNCIGCNHGRSIRVLREALTQPEWVNPDEVKAKQDPRAPHGFGWG
jgi:hypothetical protein